MFESSRYWSLDDSYEANKISDKLSRQKSFISTADTAIELIMFGLVGWKNMIVGGKDIVFPKNKDELRRTLGQILSVIEAIELSEVVGEQGFMAEHKKKSASSLPTATASSVKTAPDKQSVNTTSK